MAKIKNKKKTVYKKLESQVLEEMRLNNIKMRNEEGMKFEVG